MPSISWVEVTAIAMSTTKGSRCAGTRVEACDVGRISERPGAANHGFATS